jgi:hypothetical protein
MYKKIIMASVVAAVLALGVLAVTMPRAALADQIVAGGNGGQGGAGGAGGNGGAGGENNAQHFGHAGVHQSANGGNANGGDGGNANGGSVRDVCLNRCHT